MFWNGEYPTQIPLHKLVNRPLALLDVSLKFSPELNSKSVLITLDDLKKWESKFGRLPDDGVLFIYSGMSKFYSNQDIYFSRYRNNHMSQLPQHGVLSLEGAKWLAENRSLVGIGIDAESFEPEAHLHRVHEVLFKKEMFIVENLNENLDNFEEGIVGKVTIVPLLLEGITKVPVSIFVDDGQ